MTRIEFANDLVAGNKPVLEHLRTLKEQAITQPSMMHMYVRILRAMRFVSIWGIPSAIGMDLIGEENGLPFTIKPVKTLVHHSPLLELRVNWQGIGAFRAIFFPLIHNNDQFLVFTRSVIKQSTSDPAFKQIISDTTTMLPDFYVDPKKYINL
jgi:hypothetical protein